MDKSAIGLLQRSASSEAPLTTFIATQRGWCG